MSNGKRRPTAVLILGILSIALGALGLCTGMINALQSLVHADSLSNKIPQDLHTLYSAMAIANLVLRLILVISGIGLLLMHNWARILSLVYAVLDIPTALVGAWLFARMWQPMLAHQFPQGLPPGLESFGMAAALGVGSCGLIYPLALLIVLNLRDIRAAFTVSLPPPPELVPPGMGG